MAGRYTNELRLNLKGDEDKAQSLIPEARKLMGELLEDAAFNNLQYHTRTTRLPDGSVIEVLTNNGQQSATITVPPPPAPPVVEEKEVPIHENQEMRSFYLNQVLFKSWTMCDGYNPYIDDDKTTPSYAWYYVFLVPEDDTIDLMARLFTKMQFLYGATAFGVMVDAAMKPGETPWTRTFGYTGFHENDVKFSGYVTYPDPSLSQTNIDDSSLDGMPDGFFTPAQNSAPVPRSWRMDYDTQLVGYENSIEVDLSPTEGYLGAYEVPARIELKGLVIYAPSFTRTLYLKDAGDYAYIASLIGI